MSSGRENDTDPLDPQSIPMILQRIVPAPRVALFLVHQDGVEVRELFVGKTVVVGREPPADAHVDESTLSRRHTSFVLLPDGAHVEAEDLGSTNGTWHRGRRIERETLSIGDELILGGVLARIRLLAEPPREASPAQGDRGSIVAGRELSAVLRAAERAANSRITMLLLGETGTGKEVIARHVHASSPRASGPMICVNCGAIPKELVESTFFGHERGAFTGAHQMQRGVFESAHGGTVFLDEIGELHPGAQAALLRVLETGQITRVGASEARAVDVRIIAATHRDLVRMSEAQEFRSDLYFRLSTVTIEIPPLRRRRDDILPLARAFLTMANQTHGRHVETIAPGAAACLAAYAWPGNVRELRNVIERAVVLAEADVVQEGDLPERLRSSSPVEQAPASGRKLRARVQAYEAELIKNALDAAGGSRAEAARLLGMPLRTLAHRIKVLEIEEDDP